MTTQHTPGHVDPLPTQVASAVHAIVVVLLHEAGMGGATTTRTAPHGATRRHLSMLTPWRIQELVAPFRAHHDSASWERVRQCVITRIPGLRWRPAEGGGA